VGVADDPIADAPAQKLVDRDAERLALDVPEGDIDGADRRAEHPTRGKEAAPEHPLPEMLDPHGVLADQQGLQMADPLSHGHLAPGEPGLAHAPDPSSVSTLTKR